MKNYKQVLLATAAVAVLGTGMMSKSAQAFDEVNWVWDKLVTENVIKDVNVTIDTSPSGMLEMEKTQVHIGDVTATSTVSNISNNPPSENGDGTVFVDTTISLIADYDANQTGNPVTNVDITSPGFTDGNASGNDDQNLNQVFLTFDLSGDVAYEAEAGILDAVDLPAIESLATAVGNNQSIESSVSMELHDAQFLYGGYDTELSGQLAGLDTSGVSGNVNTNAAAFLTFAGALGGIEPASITATSDVNNILNASVASDATAVGNNMDVTLAAATADDAFFLGDVMQYAYADVSATSTVDLVNVNGYNNLAALEGPLVSSKATAVGNNMAITITSPGL